MPFSPPHADIACNFFEKLLKHTADEWYGHPFLLTPWQDQAVSEIFGQLDQAGNRVIQMVYMEVPKKTGKTEWAAGLALLVLVLSTDPGCQVYGAAAATRQAMNVYRAAAKMVEQSPILRKKLRVMRGTNRIVKRSDPDSFYAAIAADGDFGDGVNPACVIADEVHRWKTRKQLENWDVLTKGGITRRQTLSIAITTAGVQNESPLAWRLHEKTRKAQLGLVEDPSFFGRIYGADPEDDPGDPKTWIKAIPSLKENGGFLDISKIEKEYISHVAEGDLTSFKRYFLNMWDQKESRAIDMVQWDAAAGSWQAAGLLPLSPEDTIRPIPHELLSVFIERRCWVGVDLSMSTDLTAVVFVFPCEDGSFDVLPFFWMPEKSVRIRELRDGMPYGRWAEQGFIELSPGAVVDYTAMKARIEWGSRMFALEEVCFDPWNSRQISSAMTDEGFRCVEIRQGYATLSEPSKKILEMIVSGTFHHGGHPVLRWNASCVSVVERNDNLMFAKPERSRSSSRIDGLSASANAMSRAMVGVGQTVHQMELW